MKPIFVLLFLVAVAMPNHVTVSQETTVDESNFRTILDGKTLDGWDVESDYWRIEDGALVGETPKGQTLDHNTWAVWEGELGDFELRLKFKLAGLPGANSGIQVRCQVENVKHVSGYQADMDMGETWLGRIYDEHGRALIVERGTRVRIKKNGERIVEKFAEAADFTSLLKKDEWNEYRIRACGEHMTVEINGKLLSELIDEQENEKDVTGKLALQLHAGPETKVEFRDIRLRKLKPGEHTVKFKKTNTDTRGDKE